jgi:L-ascorbate metabolism protein UlaG (beta-lactamase superfamily)
VKAIPLPTRWWSRASLLGVVVVLASACAAPYQGPASAHFDGHVFFNPGAPKQSSVAGYLWLRLTTGQAYWPSAVTVPDALPPPQRVTASEGMARVTLIGHATVLIQVAGLNILTDPVWSERASFVQWLGPKRVSPPSISLQALPPIDLVLISHDHYDHLDTATLAQLHARDRPRVVAPLGNAKLLREVMPASEVSEHDWGDRVEFSTANGRAVIHVEPMLHGSGRSPWEQMKTLWAAFVIEAGGVKIYHVGDAGYGSGANFRAAGDKHGGFDLALVPIGAYEPASFMADSHMRPSDAVKAMLDSRSARAMAHHHETFQLGFEAFDAPRIELGESLAKAGIPAERFAAPRPGQAVTVRPKSGG